MSDSTVPDASVASCPPNLPLAQQDTALCPSFLGQSSWAQDASSANPLCHPAQRQVVVYDMSAAQQQPASSTVRKPQNGVITNQTGRSVPYSQLRDVAQTKALQRAAKALQATD